MPSYQLDDWLVEPHLNRISRPGELSQLEPKAMDVLAYLLSRRGEVVTTQELLAAVWAERVVEESAVHQRMSQIRSALGDDPRDPRYIANIPRRGYRIVADIQLVHDTPPVLNASVALGDGQQPPFSAYVGEESYVFVCYSHQDRNAIFPELERLHAAGVNVWYDEGISPSSEWSEEIARAIDGCALFIYYLSEQSTQSRNCRNEVSYAVGRDKRLLSIYIEELDLPAGLNLSIGSSQGMFKYQMPESDYWSKLLDAASSEVAAEPDSFTSESANHAEEESQSATSDSLGLETTGWRRHSAALGRFLVVGEGNWIYAVLGLYAMASLPMAWLVGAWPDRVIGPDPAILEYCVLTETQQQTIGFASRWNWHQYVITLPLSLYLMRFVFRISYGLSPQSPLCQEPRYSPLKLKLAEVVNDWRLPAIAIGAACAVTAVDQYDVVLRLLQVPTICPRGVMDWGWYGSLFADVSRSGIVVLTLWTTLEQIFAISIGILAALHVYRFNAAYMQTIYVRGRGMVSPHCYVLDLDDPDRRFGLLKMSRIFDLQLLLCMAGGVIMLSSRYMNTDLSVVDEMIQAVACAFTDQVDCAPHGSIWQYFMRVFQDTAQVSILVGWAVFLFTVLWIANVKRLPLRYVNETSGRLAYLEQLIPSQSKYDKLLRSGLDANVDLVAARFRQHHFWPIGDQRATDALSLCLLLVFLMIVPIVPNTVLNLLALCVAGILAFVLARVYLSFLRHMLLRVDETLVHSGNMS